MKRTPANIAVVLLPFFLLISSCKHEETIVIKSIDEIKNPNQIPLTTHFYHNGVNELKSEATIAVWMFKNEHIADWLGENVDGKKVYEPINVMWIDYKSGSIEEAKGEISQFLKNNSFKMRGGSSTGYFSFFGTDENPDKTGQYPSDKTWSDASALNDNNHGRIFIRKSPDNNAFYTLGAFSRESGISHHFISFNEARNALHAKGKWIKEEMTTDFPNQYPPADSLPFSTQDHNGVIFYVLYP
jgi:hypothetical protein